MCQTKNILTCKMTDRKRMMLHFKEQGSPYVHEEAVKLVQFLHCCSMSTLQGWAWPRMTIPGAHVTVTGLYPEGHSQILNWESHDHFILISDLFRTAISQINGGELHSRTLIVSTFLAWVAAESPVSKLFPWCREQLFGNQTPFGRLQKDYNHDGDRM